MKKILLASVLAITTIVGASDYKYETSVLAGYNFAQDAMKFKDNGYSLFSGEIQYNNLDWPISPELSFLYTDANDGQYDEPGCSQTDVARVALNGVYSFDKVSIFKPFIKAGLGYETMTIARHGNEDGAYVDAGIGTKIVDILGIDNLSLKFEAIYMLKNGKDITTNDSRLDSNIALLGGLNLAFGSLSREELVVTEPIEEKEIVVAVEEEVIVSKDDDNDGILNIQDKCANTKVYTAVDANGCEVIKVIDGDDDNDGIKNSADKCLDTIEGIEVDANGCEIVPVAVMAPVIVDGDDDNDGVKNSIDKCENSKKSKFINPANGCMYEFDLKIVFKPNSTYIDNKSKANLDKVASILKEEPAYKAEIIGYTDTSGIAAKNQKLSEGRAWIVKKLLLDKGIERSRMTSAGKGSANPIADNATKEGRVLNRRVEVKILP